MSTPPRPEDLPTQVHAACLVARASLRRVRRLLEAQAAAERELAEQYRRAGRELPEGVAEWSAEEFAQHRAGLVEPIDRCIEQLIRISEAAAGASGIQSQTRSAAVSSQPSAVSDQQ